MAGEINFGLMDPNARARVINSFSEGQQQARQNRLAEIQLANAEQAQTDDAAMRGYYQQSGGDMNRLAQLAQSGGQYRQAMDLQGKLLDQRAKTVGIAKDEAATAKSGVDTATAKDSWRTQSFAALRDAPTYENAVALLQRGLQSGILSPEEYQRGIAATPQDPAAIKQMADRAFMQSVGPAAVATNERVAREGAENRAVTLRGQDLAAESSARTDERTRSEGAATRATTLRGQDLTDKRTRETNRLKAEENGITRDGIVGKRVQDVELKLQDDYRAESKGFSETSTAMKKILGAISTADKNPGSALAAGTAFMKLLDPNSVVRESELGMALNASGWFDRATNVAQTLQSGRVMTATQQTNLKAAAEDLFAEAKSAQLEVDAAYRKRAADYGGDPSRIIVDRGQNTRRPASQSPATQSAVTHPKFPGFSIAR